MSLRVRAVAPAGHLDRDADRSEHVQVVFVGRDDGDRSLLVEFGNVVHAVFGGAVAAHVVDDPAAGYHEPIAGLLDALYVPQRAMVVDDGAVGMHFDDLPQTPQVGSAVDQRIGTPGEDRRRERVAVTAGRRVRHRYVIDRSAGSRGHCPGPYVLTCSVSIWWYRSKAEEMAWSSRSNTLTFTAPASSKIRPRALPENAVRLRIDAFALTSNNITYAVFGDAMQYWNFFPASEAEPESRSWGRVPVWGFADVVESRVAQIEPGRRVYGYWPMSTELVVEPGRFDEGGFHDLAEHRRPMAGAYNRYSFTDTDPIYRLDREAHQTVLWPLFFTSFLLDDFLADNDSFGASTVVVSSASSKTAIGAAFLLAARAGLRVVGLTSEGNADFVRSLGCYHDTVIYGETEALPEGDAVYVDIAGNLDVRTAVHARYGDRLRYSMIVGDTHWDHEAEVHEPVVGPQPVFFFAPAQIAKRTKEWGKSTLDDRVGATWGRYSSWVDGWITFEPCVGPEQVEAAYRALLDARVAPRTGYVCSMQSARA